MLAQLDAQLIIQILAIAIPLAVGAVAFIYRLHEKQDERVSKNNEGITILKTQVADHRTELDKGNERFETVATKIGSLEQAQVETKTKVDGLAHGQTRIEGKVDKLLQMRG